MVIDNIGNNPQITLNFEEKPTALFWKEEKTFSVVSYCWKKKVSAIYQYDLRGEIQKVTIKSRIISPIMLSYRLVGCLPSIDAIRLWSLPF